MNTLPPDELPVNDQASADNRGNRGGTGSTPNSLDASTHNQQPVGASPYTLDVTVAPDPSSFLPAAKQPLIQLRAIENVGDIVRQNELFKIFMTDDAAVQVQALLRLEEGDTGLDLLYPPQAPNWMVRIENMPDTGTRFTRLETDSRMPTEDTLTISADEAAGLADRIEAARHERDRTGEEVDAEGVEGQGDS